MSTEMPSPVPETSATIDERFVEIPETNDFGPIFSRDADRGWGNSGGAPSLADLVHQAIGSSNDGSSWSRSASAQRSRTPTSRS